MPESPSIYTLSLKSTTVTSCLSADAMNIFLVAKSRMSFDTASTQSVATSQCKNGSLGSFSNRLGFTCCGAAPILYSLDFIPPRRVQRKLCFVNPTTTPPLFLTPNINSNTLCQQASFRHLSACWEKQCCLMRQQFPKLHDLQLQSQCAAMHSANWTRPSVYLSVEGLIRRSSAWK